MKTIYSFNEFYDAVAKIAKAVGQDYISVRVEKNTLREYVFSAYIHTYNWYSANSMEKVLGILTEITNPSPKPNIDLEIEPIDYFMAANPKNENQ